MRRGKAMVCCVLKLAGAPSISFKLPRHSSLKRPGEQAQNSRRDIVLLFSRFVIVIILGCEVPGNPEPPFVFEFFVTIQLRRDESALANRIRATKSSQGGSWLISCIVRYQCRSTPPRNDFLFPSRPCCPDVRATLREPAARCLADWVVLD